ncbi:MAG TPA: selenium metabolism membrane protein YedE/FdhT [Chloroflexota bacterium]|jgi:uncharacterized membrane protein YedE/YeeE|nr:selenium metabolism membrane protein YedE/FdhT [Chloroflexota bacterium]
MWEQWRQRVLVRFWAPTPAVVAAGVLSAYYFGLTGTFWAVTGEFTRWGGHLLQLAGLHPETWGYFQVIGLQGLPWDRVDGWVVFGMFAGALAAALLAENVKLRRVRHGRRLVQALVGGMLAGFGARLAMGCNLAAFFTGIPQFSLHAWVFTIGTALGTYLGVKLVLQPWLRGDARAERVRATAVVGEEPAPSRARRWQPGLGVLVGAGFALVALVVATGQPKLGIAGLFGLAFGVLIERGQICFTSAFRDLWVTGRATMAKALVLGMAASAIGTAAFMQLGVAPKVFWLSPGAAIGGLLFGLGIVIAGGCETGWMYRSMEGQVHFWVVGVGNILGATLLAWAWDALGLYAALVAPWPKVYLVEQFGWLGGLLITYGLLLAAYLFLAWWEARTTYHGLQAVAVPAPQLREGVVHGR